MDPAWWAHICVERFNQPNDAKCTCSILFQWWGSVMNLVVFGILIHTRRWKLPKHRYMRTLHSLWMHCIATRSALLFLLKCCVRLWKWVKGDVQCGSNHFASSKNGGLAGQQILVEMVKKWADKHRNQDIQTLINLQIPNNITSQCNLWNLPTSRFLFDNQMIPTKNFMRRFDSGVFQTQVGLCDHGTVIFSDCGSKHSPCKVPSLDSHDAEIDQGGQGLDWLGIEGVLASTRDNLQFSDKFRYWVTYVKIKIIHDWSFEIWCDVRCEF